MQQMTLEVLISCMHQSDWSIIQRSNIQTDVLIINQCDRDAIEEYSFPNQLGKICHARMIHTTTRGLSRSRNMALRYATGDICVFCDDDEIFESDYEQTILNAFQTHVDFTIIAFKLNYDRKQCPTKTRTYNRFTSGSLSSAQIAFRRQDIIATSILFDEKMGSGTGNGGGEECKWMYQLLSKREVKAMYVPMLIATVQSGNSMWFHGYNKQFFINQGWKSRRIYGRILGLVYIFYNIIAHQKLYTQYCSNIDIIHYMLTGYMQKR